MAIYNKLLYFFRNKTNYAEARNNVASIVNVELPKAYWEVGRIIVEDE